MLKRICTITIVAAVASVAVAASEKASYIKAYQGKDDHGKDCGVMLSFNEGKVDGLMVQAIGDNTRTRKPVKVWDIMMPDQFDNLIKQAGTMKTGRFYFSAKQDFSQNGMQLKRNMGLWLNLKAGVLQFANRKNALGVKESILTKCVGLKEMPADFPAGSPLANQDPCHMEPNKDLRNMCRVNNGKQSGSIPEGAVAAPQIQEPISQEIER